MDLVKHSLPSDTRQRPWYSRSFGTFYPLVYPHRHSEAAGMEIRALSGWIGLGPGKRVLDACCGDGRHLKSLLALKCDAFGFDLSQELAIRAQTDPVSTGRICRADIRCIPFKREFDFVLNLFTSFGYFANDSENRAALAELVRCLKPGGILILDHINADHTRRTLAAESESLHGEYHIRQNRRIAGNRVQKQITITGPETETVVFHEDVRLYSPAEMTAMAGFCGLVDVSMHGGYGGDVFDTDSARMILRARRPGS